MRVLVILLMLATAFVVSFSASAQKSALGSVIEHSGEVGELIVLRDGIVYWLSVGDDLFEDDVLRAQAADSAIITYQGCEMTLPEQLDVRLDDAFCAPVAMTDEPTMAAIASEGGAVGGTAIVATGGNAPLIIGGTVLSAGGLAAAANGGNGGTGSPASTAAGAAQATSVSGS